MVLVVCLKINPIVNVIQAMLEQIVNFLLDVKTYVKIMEYAMPIIQLVYVQLDMQALFVNYQLIYVQLSHALMVVNV